MPVYELTQFHNALKKGQPLLGLDPGTIVIGVAISDPNWKVASPLTSIRRSKWNQDKEILQKIMTERLIGGLIIGLPKNMDGSEGPSAQAVRSLARNILAFADLPLAFWDERLSSSAVERFLIEDDMTRKRRNEVIDKAAAAYILQGALDALAHQG